MMNVAPVLSLLILAYAEWHDEERLRARMAELIGLVLILLPRDPALSPRLRALVPEHSDQLKWHDAEDVVDALETVVREPDDDLRVNLIALRLVIARLGGIHSQIRIGRLVSEELRNRKVADI